MSPRMHAASRFVWGACQWRKLKELRARAPGRHPAPCVFPRVCIARLRLTCRRAFGCVHVSAWPWQRAPAMSLEQALWDAAKKGEETTVEWSVGRGADVNWRNSANVRRCDMQDVGWKGGRVHAPMLGGMAGGRGMQCGDGVEGGARGWQHVWVRTGASTSCGGQTAAGVDPRCERCTLRGRCEGRRRWRSCKVGVVLVGSARLSQRHTHTRASLVCVLSTLPRRLGRRRCTRRVRTATRRWWRSCSRQMRR